MPIPTNDELEAIAQALLRAAQLAEEAERAQMRWIASTGKPKVEQDALFAEYKALAEEARAARQEAIAMAKGRK